MRDCTVINQNTTASVCSFPVSIYQERIGFYVFLLAMLLFSLSRTYDVEYNPKWIGGPRMKLFFFLPTFWQMNSDKQRTVRDPRGEIWTLNLLLVTGVNSVWAQQLDFKHQIFFVNWSCVNSVWSHFGHRCNRQLQQQNNRLAVNENIAGETLYL